MVADIQTQLFFFAELPDDDGDDEDGNAGQAFGESSPLAG
jgi:hypothetical protein